MPEKAYGSHAKEAPWKLWSVKPKPPPRNSRKNHFSLGFGEFWDFIYWVLLVGILEMFVIRFEIPLLLGLFHCYRVLVLLEKSHLITSQGTISL